MRIDWGHEWIRTANRQATIKITFTQNEHWRASPIKVLIQIRQYVTSFFSISTNFLVKPTNFLAGSESIVLSVRTANDYFECSSKSIIPAHLFSFSAHAILMCNRIYLMIFFKLGLFHASLLGANRVTSRRLLIRCINSSPVSKITW